MTRCVPPHTARTTSRPARATTSTPNSCARWPSAPPAPSPPARRPNTNAMWNSAPHCGRPRPRCRPSRRSRTARRTTTADGSRFRPRTAIEAPETAGAGLAAMIAVLAPVLAGIAAILFLLIGYVLRAFGPDQAAARPADQRRLDLRRAHRRGRPGRHGRPRRHGAAQRLVVRTRRERGRGGRGTPPRTRRVAARPPGARPAAVPPRGAHRHRTGPGPRPFPLRPPAALRAQEPHPHPGLLPPRLHQPRQRLAPRAPATPARTSPAPNTAARTTARSSDRARPASVQRSPIFFCGSGEPSPNGISIGRCSYPYGLTRRWRPSMAARPISWAYNDSCEFSGVDSSSGSA